MTLVRKALIIVVLEICYDKSSERGGNMRNIRGLRNVFISYVKRFSIILK